MEVRNQESVRVLNATLHIELMAINQYFLHYKLCRHWGYERLAKHFKDTSFEEMRDADALTERILQLEGLPNLQRLDGFQVGETPVEMIRLSETTEARAIENLQAGIVIVEAQNDLATGTMLREMIREEEGHLEWARSQLRLVEQLGEENFLTLQVV